MQTGVCQNCGNKCSSYKYFCDVECEIEFCEKLNQEAKRKAEKKVGSH